MVAWKTTPVCAEDCRHVIGSADRDDVGRLRQVLAARDSAAWNFDFATSTPLPGRYDWRRCGHTGAPDDRTAERDPSPGVRQSPATPPAARRPCSARRRLVFDGRDLAPAERTVATFLATRLTSPRPFAETTECCSWPELDEGTRAGLEFPASSLPRGEISSFCDDRRHQKTAVPGDAAAANCRVRRSSSTQRRRTAPSAMTRRRAARENRSIRVTRITGTHAVNVKFRIVKR